MLFKIVTPGIVYDSTLFAKHKVSHSIDVKSLLKIDLFKNSSPGNHQLAYFINRNKEIIPKAVIEKIPSAELRPGQKDSDALGPYDTLDEILEMLIEQSASTEEVIEQGYEPEKVIWVAEAIAKNEHKRRQASTGLKVTSKAFGSGRRFPIAARYSR